MIEILTDNTYTFDVKSDAHGTKNTWRVETGDGNISADQILDWITANCQESCPGKRGKLHHVPRFVHVSRLFMTLRLSGY